MFKTFVIKMISAYLNTRKASRSWEYLLSLLKSAFALPLIFLFTLFSSPSLKAQSSAGHDFSEDYTPIQAKGIIPFDFINHWYAFDDAHDEERFIENYEINQYYASRYLVNSGKFSFGDQVTVYLEGIKNEILKEDSVLAKEIRIYLYRGASSGLGFMMSNGMIGISNGIVANLHSRADLAFVIAHEIAHYKLKHAWESYTKTKLPEDDLDRIDIIEEQLIRDKGQEKEADSLGLILFKKAGYQASEAKECLKHLYETYHPFGRCDLDQDLFNFENGFQLPDFYLRTEVDPISTDYSYQDRRHSHPNIKKRIRLIEEMDKTSLMPEEELIFDPEFKDIQELCRLETVHWQVLEGDYLNAFYNSNCLLETYPKNRFLLKANVRASYGLAVLKVANRKINDLLVDPSRMPGPVQGLHHLLRNFNTAQLVALSRRKIVDYIALFPEDTEAAEMLSSINVILQENSNISDVYATLLKPKPDLNPILDSSLTKRQKHLKLKYQLADFYLYVLDDLRDSAKIKNFIATNQAIKDSLAKTKQLILDPTYYSLVKKAPKQIVMVSPNIFPYAKELWLLDFQTVRQIEVNFKDRFGEYRAKNASKLEMLYRLEWDKNSVADYNRMSAINALVQEAEDYGQFGFPTARSLQKYLLPRKPLHYLALADALYNIDGSDWYRFRLFDIKTGAILFNREDKEGSEITDREIAQGIIDDLEEIGLID
jgi:Zn-dependent protease with chaperone function